MERILFPKDKEQVCSPAALRTQGWSSGSQFGTEEGSRMRRSLEAMPREKLLKEEG